jgi:hypothetical protein
MVAAARVEPELIATDAVAFDPTAFYAMIANGSLCLFPGVDEFRLSLMKGGECVLKVRRAVEVGDDDSVLTTQQRIIDKLAASEVPLSKRQLAQLLKLKSTRGRFATDVSRLLGTQKIHERDGALTDDPNKFLDMD